MPHMKMIKTSTIIGTEKTWILHDKPIFFTFEYNIETPSGVRASTGIWRKKKQLQALFRVRQRSPVLQRNRINVFLIAACTF